MRATLPRTISVAILLILAAASCSSDDSSPSKSTCKTTTDCNAESATSGYLCVSNACIPCENTEECSGTVYYGEPSVCKSGRCTSSTAGAAGMSAHTGAAGRVATGGRVSSAGSPNAAAGQLGVGGTSSIAGALPTGGALVAGSPGSGLGGATIANGGAVVAGSGGTGGATGGTGGTDGTTVATAAGGANLGSGGIANGVGATGSAGLAGSPTASCPTSSAQLPDGACKPCGTCDPSIPGLTGNLYPKTSRDGLCVCETKGGYYFTKAIQSTPELCDADKDGWLRITAKQGIDSDDPVIKANARCTLRRVEEVKLVNDIGQSKSLYFTSDGTSVATSPGGSLPLYESVANDGGTRSAEQQLPMYGTRALASEELNSLTKACMSAKADHNGNGLYDVAEWEQMGPPATTSELGDYLPMYTRLSYFLELHTAWFTGTRSENGASFGTYIIQERTRAKTTDGLAIAITADPGPGGEYWRQCDRKRDSGYVEGAPGTTFDFASIGLPSTNWTGMNHHSQFKCVVGVSVETYGAMVSEVDHAAALHQQTATSLTTRNWFPNSCQVGTTIPSSAADRTNPSAPKVECTASSLLPTDEARWVSVSYKLVEEAATSYSYVRGCIYECTEKVPAIVPATCHECDDAAWGKAQDRALSPGSHDANCMVPNVCDGSGNCGECVPGTTRCKDSSTLETCQVNRTWQPTLPACAFGCNGVNNACYPACAPGSRGCQSTSQTKACNSSGYWQDDVVCAANLSCVGTGNCLKSDGQSCNSDSDCAAGTCPTFYRDSDGDGYPGTGMKVCGTVPPLGWSTQSPDCCDSDKNAFPGQTAYFTKARDICAGFDYNCDGVDTKQDLGCPSCYWCNSANCTNCNTGVSPDCGTGTVPWRGDYGEYSCDEAKTACR